MNIEEIRKLLSHWDNIVDIGEQKSITKAETECDGLLGRIKRTKGTSVIFDFETYDKLKTTQNLLCKELPEWGDLIRSEPEIMDGHPWTRGDFIELYFSHYRLVSEKLKRIIDHRSAV